MGAAVTVRAVLAWDPAALATDADRVRGASDRLDEIAGELAHSRKGLASEWLGPAGETAQRRFAEQAENGRELSRVVGQAVRALEAGAHRLRGVRDRLQSAVTAAEQDGCTVRDDGSVQPPPVPDMTYPAGTPAEQVDRLQREYDQQVQQAHTVAERHAAAVRGALDDVRLADEETAEGLRSVRLPDGMAARLVEESRASDDTVVFPAGWSPRDAFRAGSAAEWTAMVGLGAQCLLTTHLAGGRDLVNESTGYFGGGFVEGPDGRNYPLVVPRLVEDGESYGANMSPRENGPENLGGTDIGWQTIGQDYGYGQLEHVSQFNQNAVMFSGVFGNSPQPAGDLIRRPELEQHLSVGPTGLPTLTSEDQQAQASASLPPPAPPSAGAQAPGYHPERMGRIGGVIDLGISATEGFQTAQNMEDDAHHPYVLTLQEHEDGRRRAIMNVYSVLENKQTGHITIDASHGWVDEQERFRQADIDFRTPDHGVVGPPRPAYGVDP